jgi:hypothetical protein
MRQPASGARWCAHRERSRGCRPTDTGPARFELAPFRSTSGCSDRLSHGPESMHHRRPTEAALLRSTGSRVRQCPSATTPPADDGTSPSCMSPNLHLSNSVSWWRCIDRRCESPRLCRTGTGGAIDVAPGKEEGVVYDVRPPWPPVPILSSSFVPIAWRPPGRAAERVPTMTRSCRASARDLAQPSMRARRLPPTGIAPANPSLSLRKLLYAITDLPSVSRSTARKHKSRPDTPHLAVSPAAIRA